MALYLILVSILFTLSSWEPLVTFWLFAASVCFPLRFYQQGKIAQELLKGAQDLAIIQGQTELQLRELLKGLEERNASLRTNMMQLEHNEECLKIELKQRLAMEEMLELKIKNSLHALAEQQKASLVDSSLEGISKILDPFAQKFVDFKQKFGDFEQKIEGAMIREVTQRAEIRGEIGRVVELNGKLMNETANLTRAIKGDQRMQGCWGEMILNKVLEHSGLRNGHEYTTQVRSENQEGDRIIPDVIINLPDNKHIIIDSKACLQSYYNYINAQEEVDRLQAQQSFVTNIKRRVKELAEKKYHTALQLNSLEFTIMFMPIDSALALAIEVDRELRNFAWSKKVIIVSPGTLIVVLQTIESLWKLHKQNKHAVAIAKMASAMYDKLVGFIESQEDLGRALNKSLDLYNESIKKLYYGKGNLIGRALKLKEMGVGSDKGLQLELLEETSD